MAARRTPRSSSGARGRRASSRSAPASNTTGIIVGGGVVLVVVLVVAMTMFGESNTPATGGKPAPSANAVEKPVPQPAKDLSLPPAKAGKEPARPAPELRVGDLTKADAYYLKAKKMNDDGRRAQATGDNKEFNRLINDSWDTLETLDTSIETYTDWLAEADLEDWRLPPAYVKLQKRLNVYDKLRGRLRRVKGNRQKK